MLRIVSEKFRRVLILFLQRFPMKTLREPALRECKRGAAAVHCYGSVKNDRRRTKSSADQPCKLLKPSRSRRHRSQNVKEVEHTLQYATRALMGVCVAACTIKVLNSNAALSPRFEEFRLASLKRTVCSNSKMRTPTAERAPAALSARSMGATLSQRVT
jgi:hypothetical protein